VQQHHADHFHPFLDEANGNNFNLFPAPEPEDFFAASNSFLKVILYAKDENGLTTAVHRDIRPRIVKVGIQTEPEGLEVIVHGHQVVSPQEIESWKNFDLPLQVKDQPPYVFKQWSDRNKSRSHTIRLNGTESQQMITAIFCMDYNATCFEASVCCTGYCSDEGLCTYATGNGDRPSQPPPEENVETPIPPRVGNPFQDNGDQSTADSTNLNSTETVLLSLLLVMGLVCPCCMGWYYCHARPSNALSEDTDWDDLAQRQCLPSVFSSPGKESIAQSRSFSETVGRSANDGQEHLSSFLEVAGNSSSPIWEKLAEEKKRRAMLRAKWEERSYQINDESRGTPETMLGSPASTNSFSSPKLSASIDEALVRLDDILSRAFTPSRSRRSRSMESPPNADDNDPVAISAISTSLNDFDVSLNSTSNQLLIPLGDSIPESPLRDEGSSSESAEASPHSSVSGALEDDMNESAINLLDISGESSQGDFLNQESPTSKSVMSLSALLADTIALANYDKVLSNESDGESDISLEMDKDTVASGFSSPVQQDNMSKEIADGTSKGSVCEENGSARQDDISQYEVNEEFTTHPPDVSSSNFASQLLAVDGQASSEMANPTEDTNITTNTDSTTDQLSRMFAGLDEVVFAGEIEEHASFYSVHSSLDS